MQSVKATLKERSTLDIRGFATCAVSKFRTRFHARHQKLTNFRIRKKSIFIDHVAAIDVAFIERMGKAKFSENAISGVLSGVVPGISDLDFGPRSRCSASWGAARPLQAAGHPC